MSKNILKRLRLFLFLTIIIIGVLMARLAYLQVVQGDYYRYRSEVNMLRVLPITAPRGEIFDSNGDKLVSNREGFTISLGEVPPEHREKVISFLSKELNKEIEDIEEEIQKQRYRRYLPVRLATDVGLETVARIEERRLELPGVIIEVQPIRNYVYDRLASHILGYMGEEPPQFYIDKWEKEGYTYSYGDRTGKDGIELVWEPYLRGEDGGQLVEVNSSGRLIRSRDKNAPVPGNDLYLTLDAGLQRDTEQFLRDQVFELQEEGKRTKVASAVVLDPNSGKVLAMASYPDYNPNTFNIDFDSEIQAQDISYNNRAIRGNYSGGSTFKMVTAAAALEEGEVRSKETFRCGGSLTRYGATKSCFRGTAHGSINITDALIKSCNVFFYEMGLRVGIDNLAYYSREFGFGRPTGLTDIPGESSGDVASRETKRAKSVDPNWYPAETMDAAIGQGFHDFTPLQLANYTAIIANGGIHYKPYLVDRVVSQEGEVVFEAEPQLHRVDISDETIEILREGMEGVTRPGGTAGFLQRLPMETAGKTGSAQVHRDLDTHGLYVGYAPAKDPEIAFAVVIEFGGTGGSAAAPVAEKIIRSYFDIEDIEEEGAEGPEQGAIGAVEYHDLEEDYRDLEDSYDLEEHYDLEDHRDLEEHYDLEEYQHLEERYDVEEHYNLEDSYDLEEYLKEHHELEELDMLEDTGGDEGHG